MLIIFEMRPIWGSIVKRENVKFKFLGITI